MHSSNNKDESPDSIIVSFFSLDDHHPTKHDQPFHSEPVAHCLFHFAKFAWPACKVSRNHMSTLTCRSGPVSGFGEEYEYIPVVWWIYAKSKIYRLVCKTGEKGLPTVPFPALETGEKKMVDGA